jgi:hypothetical protein
MAAKKKWIAGAIKHPGALTAQAKKAGKSLSQFMASPGKNPSPTTKKRIALAKTLRKMSSKKK